MHPEEDDEELDYGVMPEVVAYSDVDSQMGEFARKVELNERILHKLQQYELMLLDAASLVSLLDVLLVSTPRLFGLTRVSLRLYDPDDKHRELLPKDTDYTALRLDHDSFDLQQLYGAHPQVEVVDVDDPRALEAGEDDGSMLSAVLLPLIRDDQLVGSFHWASPDPGLFSSPVEVDYLNHLAAVIAICLENCANAERLSLLSLLDPLTRVSNRRAFDMELRKEISRAQRNQKALSLLLIQIDDFKGIADNYGHLAGEFTLRAVARLLGSQLRTTDHLARIGGANFALLLPACSEAKAHEIAERLRSDTEFMEVDDGRGANLFASLSVGLVSWNPQNYPAINMEQLAGQLQHSAELGLRKASSAGGNRVSHGRLTTMLV